MSTAAERWQPGHRLEPQTEAKPPASTLVETLSTRHHEIIESSTDRCVRTKSTNAAAVRTKRTNAAATRKTP